MPLTYDDTTSLQRVLDSLEQEIASHYRGRDRDSVLYAFGCYVAARLGERIEVQMARWGAAAGWTGQVQGSARPAAEATVRNRVYQRRRRGRRAAQLAMARLIANRGPSEDFSRAASLFGIETN